MGANGGLLLATGLAVVVVMLERDGEGELRQRDAAREKRVRTRRGFMLLSENKASNLFFLFSGW